MQDLTPTSTLVIQNMPGIGDTVWHIKAFRAIAERTQEKAITLLTPKRTYADQLFAQESCIKHVLWHTDAHRNALKLALFLRRYHFQNVWVFGNRCFSSHIAAYLSGIPHIFGIGKRWPAKMFVDPPSLPSRSKCEHMCVQIDAFLRAHMFRVEHFLHPLLPDPKAVDFVRAQFSKFPRPWIVLGFGGSDMRRVWPQENFAALASALSQPYQNTLFLCGAPHEAASGAWIRETARKSGKNVVLVLNPIFAETMALLSLADVFIGNDSGPLNVSMALGIPTIGIFRVCGAKACVSETFVNIIQQQGRVHRGPFPKDEVSVQEIVGAFESIQGKTQ